MQVPSDQIIEKEIVGKRRNGSPVYLVRLIGGLIMILANNYGEYKVIGASPHRGISCWLSEQKCSDIQWDRSKL